MVYKKEDSVFKPVKSHLKIDFASHPIRTEGLGRYIWIQPELGRNSVLSDTAHSFPNVLPPITLLNKLLSFPAPHLLPNRQRRVLANKFCVTSSVKYCPSLFSPLGVFNESIASLIIIFYLMK